MDGVNLVREGFGLDIRPRQKYHEVMVLLSKILIYISLASWALAFIMYVAGIAFDSYMVFWSLYIGVFGVFCALIAGVIFLAGFLFHNPAPEINSNINPLKILEYLKKVGALCIIFLVAYIFLPWPQILLSKLLLPGKLKKIEEINPEKVSIQSEKFEVAGIYKGERRGVPLFYDLVERSLFVENGGVVSKLMPDGSKTDLPENSLTHLRKISVPFEYARTKTDLFATHPNFSLKPTYFDIQSFGPAPLGLIPLAHKNGYTYLNLNLYYGNEDLILKFKNSLQDDGYTVTVEIFYHRPVDDKKNELLLVCLLDRYSKYDNDNHNDFCFILRARDQFKKMLRFNAPPNR